MLTCCRNAMDPQHFQLPTPPQSAGGNGLPLRSPCPTETKQTATGVPTHKRIVSIDLPPPKRAGTRSKSSVRADETVRPCFPGLWQSLLTQNDLLLSLTTEYLAPNDLFNLYCIDKEFHETVDRHATAWIRSVGRNWATVERPASFTEDSESRNGEFVNAMRYAPLGCYSKLCRMEKEVIHIKRDFHPDTCHSPRLPGKRPLGASNSQWTDVYLANPDPRDSPTFPPSVNFAKWCLRETYNKQITL